MIHDTRLIGVWMGLRGVTEEVAFELEFEDQQAIGEW